MATTKLQYLVALMEKKVCTVCSRVIKNPPKKYLNPCWRCWLRAYGVTSRRIREQIKYQNYTPRELELNKQLYVISKGL